MSREARGAMWATCFMISLSFLGFGSFLAYQELVMPPPAALSEAGATQSFELPTPILETDVLAATEAPRSDLRAHLATPADLAREARETAAALAGDDAPPHTADVQPSAAVPSRAPEAEPSQLAAAKLAALEDKAGPAANSASPQLAAAASPKSVEQPLQLAAAERTRPATYAPPASDENASFDDLVASARQLFAQGQAKQALLAYDRALRPRPHAIEALLGKAAALFALKDYDAARSTAQEAVALEPSNRDGLLLIGSTWEQLGNMAAAKDIYQRCVDQANETHSAPCRQRLTQLDARP